MLARLRAAWRALLTPPALTTAHDKRRLEALLQGAGMSRSVARRLCVDYFSRRDK